MMMSPSCTLVLVPSLIRSRRWSVMLLGWIFDVMFIFCGNRFSAEFPLDYTGQHP